MSKEWFESVVSNWIEAMESQLGLSVEEIEAARRYIDGEYQPDFDYPSDYLALRAFFMLCMNSRGKEAESGEHWADPFWVSVAATERGYRMGYAHGLAAAQKQAEEKPGEDNKEA